jgi:hypothetical protein
MLYLRSNATEGLPAVWPLSLNEEQRLRIFDNRVLNVKEEEQQDADGNFIMRGLIV